jgi:hypothetical protein
VGYFLEQNHTFALLYLIMAAASFAFLDKKAVIGIIPVQVHITLYFPLAFWEAIL